MNSHLEQKKMKTSIVFRGRVPSKKNSLRRIQVKGRLITAPSVQYCDWEQENVLKVRLLSINELRPPYSIAYKVYAPDKRVSDLTNKIEGVNDCLVKAGVIKDDNWFLLNELSVVFAGVDRESPRIEVEITSSA
jgi:Holliday junction resolvase RusA-like endonuclease